MKRVILAGAVCAMCAGGAGAATLDFENFNHGDSVESTSADGVNITVEAKRRLASGALSNASTLARVFDTNNPTGGDDDLEAPFTDTNGVLPNLSPNNILVIAKANMAAADLSDHAFGGFINFTFDKAIAFNGFDIFDDVQGFTVIANEGRTDQKTSSAFSVARDNEFATINMTGWDNVVTLKFDFEQSSGGIDNIRFSVPTSTTPVPLPGSLPLLLAGIGFAGVAVRRRK